MESASRTMPTNKQLKKMRFSSTDPIAGIEPENIKAAIEALKANQFYHL